VFQNNAFAPTFFFNRESFFSRVGSPFGARLFQAAAMKPFFDETTLKRQAFTKTPVTDRCKGRVP